MSAGTRSAVKRRTSNVNDAPKESDTTDTKTKSVSAKKEDSQYKGIENHGYEFGGPYGCTALMIWSHYILIYFWYCLETNEGMMVIPTSVDSLVSHLQNLGTLFIEKGTPSTFTWGAYFSFFFMQILLAAVMPGLTMEGLPTAPHGVRLLYHCNGYLCYYFCVFGVFVAHYLGWFPLSYLADHFGETLIASIIIADGTSLFWYIYGLLYADAYNGRALHTGNIPYDFFMGTILYPRIGEIDIKMIAECRWSWTTLFLLTLSCAYKQYESMGYVSPNMLLMLVAHWLYSNATAKGEHCIPCTWDMFHENYGWMLNFWNICGVPFLYCYQSMYILRNQAKISASYPPVLAGANFLILLVGYYVFDSANAQKANMKIRVVRNTFPQVAWGMLQEPIALIRTPRGNLLVDGWYAFARKMQYTGDILMALSWGLACGFHSSLPYFYVTFFTSMILHRQGRDEIRCAEKYGTYWKEYTDLVPNVFLPDPIVFFKWIFTGKHPLDNMPHLRSVPNTRGMGVGMGMGGPTSSPTTSSSSSSHNISTGSRNNTSTTAAMLTNSGSSGSPAPAEHSSSSSSSSSISTQSARKTATRSASKTK
mmetsp:Transcript_30484/g.51493  ORF Transcript_30484/g.51493 Transcript_30484/m.51493 type:complete len:592 (+) Transcript_30484:40-1815(+)